MRLLRASVAASLALGLAGGGIYVAARAIPLPPGFFERPSTVVRYADGSPAHVFLSPDDKLRIAVEDLSEVDPRYIEALLAFEDARFWDHPGVDPAAIVRAALSNLFAGEVVSGASTLTMQLVRMREPRPRTLGSKVIEAFRALQVEARLDKPAILRAYLAHLPFGKNREGIAVAARAFFDHGPEALGAGEIATLLAIPQRPAARAPSPENAGRLRRAREHVLATLRAAGLFAGEPDPGPVPTSARPAPREVPHLAFALRARFPGRTRLDLTLRRDAQRAARRIVAGARGQLARQGIHHGAAIAVEHASGDVVALVGNLDFWSGEHASQIGAHEAPRAVGSTLKPFLYGLALDAGRLLPETLVADVPRIYPGYRPENYDGEFRGAVRARDALAMSLNLPFVDMLADVGVEAFIGQLVGLGAESLDDTPGRHGLSAALGALELAPLELAGLYTAVARDDGRSLRPRLLAEAPAPEPLAFLSPGAAHLVRDALDDQGRPDFPARARFTGLPSGVHWKTGTSFAHRDAWAVGSDAVHTVLVWLGNLDRRPSPALVGASAAGPLFFDLVEGLPGARGRTGGSVTGLGAIEVCAVSGRPAGPACPHTERSPALLARVPIETCALHQHRWVGAESGLEIPPGCVVSEPRRKLAFEVWPPEIVRFLGVRSRSLPAPPARHPGCGAARRGAPPKIRAPTASTRLLVPGLGPEAQEVPLEADGAGALEWFVDGRFLGRAGAGERLWWTPELGRHELLVMDDAGRASRHALEVRSP